MFGSSNSLCWAFFSVKDEILYFYYVDATVLKQDPKTLANYKNCLESLRHLNVWDFVGAVILAIAFSKVVIVVAVVVAFVMAFLVAFVAVVLIVFLTGLRRGSGRCPHCLGSHPDS